MPFTTEEQYGLKSQYDIDISELLIQGYTEEEIRSALDSTLVQEQPDITSTAPIEQEEISLPPQSTFDPEGYEYDYDSANKAGITPDETGHWPSRDPNTGLILKGTNHETFHKTIAGEEEAGYEITKGEDGRYYSQQKQNYPQMFQGLDIDVDSLLAEGYSMDEIQAVSDQFKENPPEDSPQGIANSIKGEVSGAFDDVNKAVETADIITPGVKDAPIAGVSLQDHIKNLKVTGAELFPGIFGYGTEKLGEVTGSKGMDKWGEELQSSVDRYKQKTWAELSPSAKKALQEYYFDPQVGEFASKLWDNVFHGKEIKREDFPETFWGNASTDKILLDLSSGIASAPLMLTGLGFTKFLGKMGLGTTASSMVGVGTPFALTEGLSVGKSINELVDGMSHEELYSAPLVQSIDNVIREKFPNATPASIEKFVRLQVGNQLAFEYGGYAGAFSLITDGGIGAMAFKKIRKQVEDAAVSSATKRSFMKRIGNVAYVTGAEFAQEFGQEGLNKLFENFAAQDVGRDIGSFTDVPNAAMSGGIGGTGTGVVLGTGVELLEGSKAKKIEKAESIDKAVKEDRKLSQEEATGLPKGVVPTDNEGLWQKVTEDEEGKTTSLLIGLLPSKDDPSKTVFKVVLPDETGGGNPTIYENEFGSLEDASDFIDQQWKPQDEITIEEVEDESTEVPTETEEEEQTDTTEDEQEDVEDIGEDIDEELVAEEDDPTTPVEIDEPIDEEEIIDEDVVDEVDEGDAVPDTGAIADLKAEERELLDTIENARELDPQSVPALDQELEEIRLKISELQSVEETEVQDVIEDEIEEEPVDEVVEEDVGKVTSAGEMIDGREKFTVDDLRVEIRNDGSTIIVTNNKGEMLSTVQVNSKGKFGRTTKTKEGMKVGNKLTKALKEAGEKVKRYHENKPLSSGKPQGKEELPKRPFNKLTIKSPWDSLIVDGEKTLETRGQPLPEKHIGKTIVLKNEKHEAVGEVVFSGSREIKSQEEFDSLEDQHKVGKDSQFGFGSRKRTYVWEVESYKKYDTPQKLDPMKGQTPIQPQASGKPQGQKTEKKKKKEDNPEEGQFESKSSPLWKLKRMLIPEEEVIKRSDIIQWFQDTFKKKIKSFSSIIVKDAGGLFFPKSESVRIKNPNDIEVASHEMAHWLETEIDRAFQQEGGVTIDGKNYKQKKGKVGRSIWISGSRNILTKEMQEELQDLDYDQREKGGRRNYEGFAEYFRLLLSGHKMGAVYAKKSGDGEKRAGRTAPHFHEFFMEKLLGNKDIQNHFKNEFGLDIVETIESGKKLFTKWYGQGSFNRMLASSGMIEKKEPVLSRIRKVWEKVEEFFNIEYDQLHKLQKTVERINAIRKRNGLKPLRPSKDPFQIATSENLSNQKIAFTLINDRVINHNAEEILVVTKQGESEYEVGSKVTQRELDEANKGSSTKAEAKRMKTLVESFGNITEKEMNGFVVYGIALRSANLHKRGIESGMARDDVDWVLDHKEEYGWKPEWDQSWKDITEWHGVLLDWLVDAGRMSDEMRTLFREANPVYLPFKRAFVDDAIGKGGGDMMTPSSLKRMKGSTRELLNPLQAMEQHTTSMISLAIKSRIMTALADVVPTNGIGDLIAQVPAKARSMKTFVGPLKKQLKQIIAEDNPDGIEGIDDIIDNIEDDQSLQIFYRDNTYRGKKDNQIVPIFRDGKIVLYEVDKELADVIAETTRFESDIGMLKALLKVLRPFASMARIGWTGLNLKFNLWTNPMRDIPLASIYTKGKSNPFRFVKGIKTSAKEWVTDDVFNMKDNEWTMSRRFKGGGGNVATIHGLEQSLWQAQHGQLNWRRKGVNKTMMFMKHPIKGVSTFMGGVHGILSATELGPRITEFESVYSKTQEIQERAIDKQKNKQKLTEEEVQHLDWTEEDHYINAKQAAKDVTFNYTKSGKWGKLINQAWPFHNATMQGPNKAYRSWKDHPKKFLLRSIMYITMPALMSWYLSKDEEWYKNIGNNYNNMNLFFDASHFPGLRDAMEAMGINPKDKIMVIPVPHETGMIFGSIPRAFLDEIFLKRNNAILEAVKDAVSTVIPSIGKDLLTGKGFKPAIVAPMAEVSANESHWGRSIVPPYMTNSYQPRLPEDQVFPWTSRFSRLISEQLVALSKATNTKAFKYNPIELDYMLKQYTGGLGTQGITFVEDSIYGTKSGRSPLELTLRMPHRPARQIELFYLEYNELQGIKASGKATGRETQRLKLMRKFKKDNLDVLNKRKRAVGSNGIPEGDADVEKLMKIHKQMASRLNAFLGNKYKDLK